jgi:hypothetical protein
MDSGAMIKVSSFMTVGFCTQVTLSFGSLDFWTLSIVSLPSPEDGNIYNFRNVVFSSYLEFWTMCKVHKLSQNPLESAYTKHVTTTVLEATVLTLLVGGIYVLFLRDGLKGA